LKLEKLKTLGLLNRNLRWPL